MVQMCVTLHCNTTKQRSEHNNWEALSQARSFLELSSQKELGARIYCFRRNGIWPLQGSSSWLLLNFRLQTNIFAFMQRHDAAGNFTGGILFYMHSKSQLPALLAFLFQKESERPILRWKWKLESTTDFACYWCKGHTVSVLQRPFTTQDIVMQQLLPRSAWVAGLGKLSPAEPTALTALFHSTCRWSPKHTHPCCSSRLPPPSINMVAVKKTNKKAVYSSAQFYPTLNSITGCSKWIPAEDISACGWRKGTVSDSEAVFIKDMEIPGYLGYLLIWSLT